MQPSSGKPTTDPGGNLPPVVPPGQTDIVRIAAALLATSCAIALLYFGRDVLIPLAVAFLISFALNPLVTRMERHGIHRTLGTIGVMTLVVMALSGLGVLLGSQVRALSLEIPTYQSTISEKLSNLREQIAAPGAFDAALETVNSVQEEVQASPEDDEGANVQRVEIAQAPQTPTQRAYSLLSPVLDFLATAGIVFVLVFLALLDSSDLRDRLLRILGGNLHRSTDAIEEAVSRISKYLLMQLIVNVTYAIPMALGLYLIGVPGALLWGSIAAVLRFVPYLGPLIAAVFPLALAFAVDPGWDMVLWTAGLILMLELASNNIVEPLLYGTSTGLSAMSLIVAATFWTVLWGPIGLVLSTPLTVCLLVVGRNLPQLGFLDTLLGSKPALDLPTRLYQRLIADDADEAIEIAIAEIEAGSVREFYNQTAIGVLRLASMDHLRATAEHRLRVTEGMDALIDALREDYPPPDSGPQAETVVCLGGKWELDTIAAELLAHALTLEGIAATYKPPNATTPSQLQKLDLSRSAVVCISFVSNAPAAPARQLCRRLRHRWPDVCIVLALWNPPPKLLQPQAYQALGADAVVASVDEAIHRMQRLLSQDKSAAYLRAHQPENEPERVAVLHATGVLDGHAKAELDTLAKRAVDVFDVKFAVITAIDTQQEYFIGQSRDLPGIDAHDEHGTLIMPRGEAMCDHVVAKGQALVIADTERDPRFADHPAIKLWNSRFYAGVPLRTQEGCVLGAFCILDTKPHTLSEEELALLQELAADAIMLITGTEPGKSQSAEDLPPPPSATVGQPVPE